MEVYVVAAFFDVPADVVVGSKVVVVVLGEEGFNHDDFAFALAS